MMYKIFLLVFLACIPISTYAEMVVIVNKNNKISNIELSNLQDIYMGRLRAFKDGNLALPIDQAKLRADFYQKLTQRPIEQINAYWARIMFSGEASPPRIELDDASVISIVKANSGAIGYISIENTNKEVKVLLKIK
jgi:ABC-type phosphate transport system substrate-binding protein